MERDVEGAGERLVELLDTLSADLAATPAPEDRTQVAGESPSAHENRAIHSARRVVEHSRAAGLAHRVEETIRGAGTAEVPSQEVGMAILGPLRELDEVAYLRFASVYRNFSCVADFEAEIADLRAAAPARTGDVGGRGDTAGETATDATDVPAARAGD